MIITFEFGTLNLNGTQAYHQYQVDWNSPHLPQVGHEISFLSIVDGHENSKQALEEMSKVKFQQQDPFSEVSLKDIFCPANTPRLRVNKVKWEGFSTWIELEYIGTKLKRLDNEDMIFIHEDYNLV